MARMRPNQFNLKRLFVAMTLLGFAGLAWHRTYFGHAGGLTKLAEYGFFPLIGAAIGALSGRILWGAIAGLGFYISLYISLGLIVRMLHP